MIKHQATNNAYCLLSSLLEKAGVMTGLGSQEITTFKDPAHHWLGDELFQSQKRLPQRTAGEAPSYLSFHLLYKLTLIIHHLISKSAPAEPWPHRICEGHPVTNGTSFSEARCCPSLSVATAATLGSGPQQIEMLLNVGES